MLTVENQFEYLYKFINIFEYYYIKKNPSWPGKDIVGLTKTLMTK
jgi:hypothetical protein